MNVMHVIQKHLLFVRYITVTEKSTMQKYEVCSNLLPSQGTGVCRNTKTAF